MPLKDQDDEKQGCGLMPISHPAISTGLLKDSLTAFLLTAMLLGGSLRAVFKYLPLPLLISLLMLGGGFLFYLAILGLAKGQRLFRLAPIRRPKAFCLGILIAMTATSGVIYPLADARRGAGGGSTADDAMILAARSFRTSGSMYGEMVPPKIPISSGPGWVLLNLPLANPTLYWLLSPFYILLAVFAFSWAMHSARPAAFALCLLSSSLLFWELLTTGQDLVAVGFAFAILTLATWQLCRTPRPSWPLVILTGVLAGLVATSRFPFAGFPMLLALLAWKNNRTTSLLIAGAGMLTVVGLHAGFYATSNLYQPFHLFTRGGKNIGIDLIGLGLLAETFALIFAYRGADSRVSSWLHGTWLCLFIPLLLIAFGELRTVAWSFAHWEGANYLFPCIPLYLFYIAAKYWDTEKLRNVNGPFPFS